MEHIAALFTYVIRLFQIDFTLYGYTFSLWEVFVFSVVASIICRLLWEVFLGD